MVWTRERLEEVAHPPGRRQADRRRQPRAVHPRLRRRRNPLHAAGQRPDHRPGPGHAGLRRHLGGHGSGDADRAVADERGRVAVPPEDPAYTLRRVWLSKEEEAGLLLRLRQRGPLAALPRRLHAAALRRRRLGAVPARQPQVRRRRARRGRPAGRPWSSSRTTTSPCCRACSRRPGPTWSSCSSGTSPGPTARSSASAPGRRRSSTACWATTCWPSTFSTTATTSSTPWTAAWRRRWTSEHFAVTRGGQDHAGPAPADQHRSRTSRRPCARTDVRAGRAPPAQAAAPAATGRCSSAWIAWTTSRAFRNACGRSIACSRLHPEMQGQVLPGAGGGAPAGSTSPTYRRLNEEVEALVEEINWRHGDGSWRPIVFLHEHYGPAADLRPVPDGGRRAWSARCTTA